MIAFLEGKLVECSPTELVLDVNGVGYSVHIPLSTFEALRRTDGRVKILTYLHVREDTMQLYGFATEAERGLFRLLLSVSGIGPKMAQGILSGLSAEELKNAIGGGNVALLTSIPGVGRKTAERMVIDLRDKITRKEVVSQPAAPSSKQMKLQAEAIVALMSLGYTRQSAEKSLNAVLRDSSDRDLSLEEMIKRSLRHVAS